mmetsp:Transcript_23268/g.81093  ORF Transcript_23268/g.81093 Transcript_23268/m.81093 type:complete len:200 (+) Transcript_23268:120-719(+)
MRTQASKSARNQSRPSASTLDGFRSVCSQPLPCSAARLSATAPSTARACIGGTEPGRASRKSASVSSARGITIMKHPVADAVTGAAPAPPSAVELAAAGHSPSNAAIIGITCAAPQSRRTATSRSQPSRLARHLIATARPSAPEPNDDTDIAVTPTRDLALVGGSAPPSPSSSPYVAGASTPNQTCDALDSCAGDGSSQ